MMMARHVGTWGASAGAAVELRLGTQRAPEDRRLGDLRVTDFTPGCGLRRTESTRGSKAGVAAGPALFDTAPSAAGRTVLAGAPGTPAAGRSPPRAVDLLARLGQDTASTVGLPRPQPGYEAQSRARRWPETVIEAVA